MSLTNVVILLQKELRDALRNRWLWLFALAFAVLALAIGTLALTDTGGILGFSRTAAGLINLVLLLVPLLGLTLGAQSVAGERERRTLPYLLAQPLGRSELLLGKFLGLTLALGAALAIGFGAAGVVLSQSRVDPGVYALIALLSVVLGITAIALGMLISVLARQTAVALGVAVLLWFGLVLLADLGLMGTTMALRLPAGTVFLLAMANPLQVFKVAAVLAIRPGLEVLGPAGLYGVSAFGRWLWPLLIGLLAAWAVVPYLVASAVFARKGES